jgi:hypothetical protein
VKHKPRDGRAARTEPSVSAIVVAAVAQDEVEAHAVAKALAAHGWPVERLTFDGSPSDAQAQSAAQTALCIVALWSSEAARNQRLVWAAEAAHRRIALAPISPIGPTRRIGPASQRWSIWSRGLPVHPEGPRASPALADPAAGARLARLAGGGDPGALVGLRWRRLAWWSFRLALQPLSTRP